VEQALTNTLEGRSRPSSVLINSFDLETTTTPDDLVRRGVKETYMVGDTGIEPVTSSV
jgi:hypothetical protein